jgi:hypothetical protein
LLWVLPAPKPAGPEDSTAGDALRAGSRWRLLPTLDGVEGPVHLATCASPVLVDGGAVAEGLSIKLAWRTAAGIDATGHRLWIVALARGRNGHSGVTLAETAETLRDLGAVTAINLDGGGSTCVDWPPSGLRLMALFPIRRPIHHALRLAAPVAPAPE